MSNLVKKKNIINLLLFTIFSSILFYGFSSGVSGLTLLSGNQGCSCHGPQSSGVMVLIAGPDTLRINQTVDYTVTITGGPLLAAGVNIAGTAGTLNIKSVDLKKIGNELTHSTPKPLAAGSVQFIFSYTAPANSGTTNLHATGNSVNFDRSQTGDQWNFAPMKSITITPATNIDDDLNNVSYKLNQNFPNPFNPTTKISYQLPITSYVSLIVYDVLGNEVANLVDEEKPAGNYEIEFDASNLPSGIYYYAMITDLGSLSRKMILMR